MEQPVEGFRKHRALFIRIGGSDEAAGTVPVLAPHIRPASGHGPEFPDRDIGVVNHEAARGKGGREGLAEVPGS